MEGNDLLGAISTEPATITGETQPEAVPAVEGENPEAVEGEKGEEKEEVKEEPKKEPDLFSKRFAALSRKERALRQKESQLNAKIAELEGKMKALEAPKEEVKPSIPLEKRLKQNPLEALKELGLSYEKLTELALNDGKVSVEDRLELMKEELEAKHQAEIEAIKNEMIERDKKQEQQKYDEVIQNFMVELTDFVNTNEDYELIRANDAVKLVFDVIEQHHSNTGRILSSKEAADCVESYLMEEAQKLLKLKKLGYKTQPVTEKKPEAQSTNKPTLSNNSASSLSNKVVAELASDADLKKAAAAMLKWD